MFLSVWVHLGPFRYYTKLETKQVTLVQLMEKFVPRCLVTISHNERSRSAPLDPKLMFWCVYFFWVHMRPFCYFTKLGAKWSNLVQLMQKFVPGCLVRVILNERSRSTPLDPKLMFWCDSFCLGAFGTVSLLHKTRNKTCHTGAINGKVRATMSCYNFT